MNFLKKILFLNYMIFSFLYIQCKNEINLQNNNQSNNKFKYLNNLPFLLRLMKIKAKTNMHNIKKKLSFLKNKNFLEKNIVIPLFIKFEDIKDDGLTKNDILMILGIFCTSYGIKKFFPFSFIRNNITNFGIGIGFFIVIYLFLKIDNIAKQDNYKTFSFIIELNKQLSFTDEQLAFIFEYKNFYNLIRNAINNPKVLISNKGFMEFLNNSQKTQLCHIFQ